MVRDFAGHGVGVEFHEPPQILHYGYPGVGETLLENMTFTIEPMINMGGFECKISMLGISLLHVNVQSLG